MMTVTTVITRLQNEVADLSELLNCFRKMRLRCEELEAKVKVVAQHNGTCWCHQVLKTHTPECDQMYAALYCREREE